MYFHVHYFTSENDKINDRLSMESFTLSEKIEIGKVIRIEHNFFK